MNDEIYRQIVFNSSFGYAYTTLTVDDAGEPQDLTILEVNEEFKKIYGLSNKAVINKPFTQLFPPNYINKWLKKYAAIALRKTDQSIEQYYAPVDKWIRVRCFSPRKNYLVLIAIDITEEMNIVRCAGEFLEDTDQAIDYQKITDDLQSITNSALVVFNQFSESQRRFQTKSVSGISIVEQQLVDLIGFPIVGKQWQISNEQYQDIKKNTSVTRKNLAALFTSTPHEKIAQLLAKSRINNPITEINIKVEGTIIGDFILVHKKNSDIKNKNLAKLYARLIGLAHNRREIRQHLNKSKADRELILEATENGFWDCNFETGTVEYNDRYFTMLGYDSGELPHTMAIWKDLMHPDDLKMVAPRIEKEIYNGNAYAMNFRLKTKNGHWKWILGKGRGFRFDESGTIKRALGIHIDIDKIKKLEEKLQNSLEKQQLITNNIPNAIWSAELDQAGAFVNTYISTVVDKLLALPQGTIGNDWQAYFQYIVPGYLPKIMGKFKEGKQHPGQIIAFEYEVIKGNGEKAWFYSAGKAHQKEGNFRFFGYTADITQQKKMTLDLQKNRARYEKAEKLGKVGNWEFDLATHSFWGSVGAKAIYGLDPDVDIFAEEDVEKHIIDKNKVHNAMTDLIEKGKDYNIEFDIIAKDTGEKKRLSSRAELEYKKGVAVKVTGVVQDITDIRKKEKKLRESEARNRILFDASADAIMHMNDKQFIDCNQATLDLLNADREYIIGKKPSQISPEKQEDGEYSTIKERQVISIALKQGTHRFEWTLLKKTGGLLYVEVQLTRLPSSTEDIFLNVAWRDLTAKKHVEQQLKRNRNHFQALFEYAPAPLWEEDFSSVKEYMTKLQEKGVKNLDAYFDNHPEEIQKCIEKIKILNLNHAAAKLHGAKNKAELLGNLGKIISEKSYSKFKIELLAMAENKDNCSFDMIASTLDGEEIYTSVFWKTVPGHEKNMDRVFVSSIDVTEQKKATEKIKENEERLRSIYNAIPDLFFEFDRACNFVDYKVGNEADLYKNPVNFIGKSCYSVLPKPVADLTKEMIEKTLSQHTIQEYTYELEMNGEINYFDSRMVPKGKNTVLTIVRNVTEKRALEEENRRLEALRNRSQKLETIGTLAGGIAHDFNNMLTPIMGYANIIQMQNKGENATLDEEVTEILKASQRAKELVEQMLSFSREAEQERRPINIIPVIKEALKLLRSSIPERINIKMNINRLPFDVLADPTKIHQVIMNLATNAFHAMEQKGGTLSVSLDKIYISEKESLRYPNIGIGEYAWLLIEDTGCGMEDDLVNRIFEPFFTTKEAGKGTGMGLSVVHGIIKSHDGHIYVDSEPEVGTRFEIFLPALKKRRAAKIDQIVKETLPKGTEAIMVLDDRDYISTMLNNMLSAYGYKVYPFNNSSDALKAINKYSQKFDLIITDRNMPGMSGMEFSKRVSQDYTIPIMMLTGQGHNITQTDIQKVGIRKMLNKPILLDEILQSVREVLDGEE